MEEIREIFRDDITRQWLLKKFLWSLKITLLAPLWIPGLIILYIYEETLRPKVRRFIRFWRRYYD